MTITDSLTDVQYFLDSIIPLSTARKSDVIGLQERLRSTLSLTDAEIVLSGKTVDSLSLSGTDPFLAQTLTAHSLTLEYHLFAADVRGLVGRALSNADQIQV